MKLMRLLPIAILSIALTWGCKKSGDPTPTEDDDNTSTNDSVNCIAGVDNDFESLPASVQPIFFPSGFWAGAWNDADAASTGSVTFDVADSCYANSYIKFKYEVGANGYFGGSMLNNNDWNAKIASPSGITEMKFSAKATTGFKFRWTCFPDGVNVQDSLTGDGDWHDYTTTFTANPEDSVTIPMNFEGWNEAGASVGDSLFLEIRNLRVE